MAKAKKRSGKKKAAKKRKVARRKPAVKRRAVKRKATPAAKPATSTVAAGPVIIPGAWPFPMGGKS